MKRFRSVGGVQALRAVGAPPVEECARTWGSGRIVWRSAWRMCWYVPFVFMSGRMSPPIAERVYAIERPLIKEHIHGSVASCG